MREITVIGGVNMDLVARVEALPRPGETVLARGYLASCGGKAANQAVAAARMGARVRFVGCVGDDAFGRRARAALAEQGVDVTGLATVDAPTGLALISVDSLGQNLITVVPGANALTWPTGEHDIVLTQLETPFQRPRAKLWILNPAPARSVPLDGVDIVIPNEIEAEMLTGERDPARAASALERAGAARAIITLGDRGVFADGRIEPALRVSATDTVGAGDAFCGAFAAALAFELADPIRFAQACAALKVTLRGPQALPTRAEVDAMLLREG